MRVASEQTTRRKIAVDPVGIAISCLLIAGLLLPFVTFKANRIVQGDGRLLLDSLPSVTGQALLAGILLCALFALCVGNARLRLAGAAFGLLGLIVAAGISASFLVPQSNSYVRVSLASGFWVLFAGLSILATDALARLNPRPLFRLLLLLLLSGLSVMKEFHSRSDIFLTEAIRHVALALGSVVAASAIAVPIGLLCARMGVLRASVLNTLTIVQTIPSIALFGLLIAPLSWIAAQMPGAAALGIRGIGAAPAFIALVVYALLPIVSNTVVGLSGVASSVREAARGLGMTAWQRLVQIELPLALPIILTGIRIVLVQNIGLATIAALIGGGGLGVFVFQGIGQTAMDLVLLGTLPTVVFGFSAAVLIDALIDALPGARTQAP